MKYNVGNELKNFYEMIHYIRDNTSVWKRRVKELDDETQDYLHKLELLPLNAIERSKIAKELTRVRRERRHYKDLLSNTETFREWLGKSNVNTSIQELENVVSKTITTQSEVESRVYKYKVLDEPPIKRSNSNE